jgi:hypothetical protein
MKMKIKYMMFPAFALSALLVACGEKKTTAEDHHGHSHKEGEAHGDPSANAKAEEDHGHSEELALGKFKAGDLEIEAAQGHGMVEAGKEGHLVIMLPYKDNGASIVRAWVGSEDRTMSAVGKGQYAPAHGDYDIHATAPSPLPADCKWWVEVEKPDGTKLVGSIAPKM